MCTLKYFLIVITTRVLWAANNKNPPNSARLVGSSVVKQFRDWVIQHFACVIKILTLSIFSGPTRLPVSCCPHAYSLVVR